MAYLLGLGLPGGVAPCGAAGPMLLAARQSHATPGVSPVADGARRRDDWNALLERPEHPSDPPRPAPPDSLAWGAAPAVRSRSRVPDTANHFNYGNEWQSGAGRGL